MLLWILNFVSGEYSVSVVLCNNTWKSKKKTAWESSISVHHTSAEHWWVSKLKDHWSRPANLLDKRSWIKYKNIGAVLLLDIFFLLFLNKVHTNPHQENNYIINIDTTILKHVQTNNPHQKNNYIINIDTMILKNVQTNNPHQNPFTINSFWFE